MVPISKAKPFIKFEPQDESGIFELVCLEGLPTKTTTNRPDGSYATKDLFIKHPTLEGYKYYSRLDDTLTLVNGEKANPLVMEGTIREHTLVSEAVVYGAGKASLGMFIFPAPEAEEISSEHFLELIWPLVEMAHLSMPDYARISKDMITILPIGADYPRTDKRTIIRQAFYRQFAAEIEHSYAEISAVGARSLSEEETREFLRSEIPSIMRLRNGNALSDDADFFNLGMNSLESIQLRTLIVKCISTNGRKLASNVVFDYPSITLLANHLNGSEATFNDYVAPAEDIMHSLIARYGKFEKHIPREKNFNGHYVVSHSCQLR
jgi:hypothetical protein